MSGLEPIAALGLVCNILQLVELGQKTIGCIKTVYQEGKLDPDLEQNAVVLERLTNEIKRESRSSSKKYEAILLQSAVNCSTAARDLQEELRFLFGNTKRGNFVSAVKITATVKWRERRLERLARNLDMEEKRLQTGLLAQVWSSTNAAHIDTRGVRRELRFFIEQYRQGRRETTDLVSSESLKTRELILSEAQGTNEAVALMDQKLNRLVVHQADETDDQVRERFLKSLKYPDLNQRRNQVRAAHEDTLKWIFVGDNADETEDEIEEDLDYREISDGTAQKQSDPELVSSVKWDSFSNWLRSTDTIYWISGKPGSGKTTLIKYILAHPRTRMYLDIWSPGCMIVSHYFWRPGSPMERNLEGLFCSLLYQMLESNETALKQVVAHVPGSRDSFTDWSSAELRVALLKALDTCDNGICLFLDGLDEIKTEDVTQDGLRELLDFVTQVSQTRKVKLCLASRPSPLILEMRLSMHPKLRLQDLNHSDMMAYAKEHVNYSWATISDDYDAMVDSLVHRAEGVFLWLILAIKSINEGVLYHDSAETLTERINHLPKGLDRLYQDMWARAGADSPSEYRKTAALYFKLLISSGWGSVPSSGQKIAPVGIGIFDHGTNVFDLMLATTPTADGILDALDDESKLVGEQVMQQRCREVERKLKIYCMGLVEEKDEDEDYFAREASSDWNWYGHTYDSTWGGATNPQRLEFIHRTARDFLTDTEMGSKILGYDTSSGFALQCQLLIARFAKLAIFASDESAEGWADLLRRFRETWKGTDQWVSKDWDRLVLICEKLANSGRLFAGVVGSAEPCGGIRFLTVLTDRGSDDEIIIKKLKSTQMSIDEKTAVLLSLSGSYRVLRSGKEFQSRFRTFRELLRAGADPNCHTWLTTFVEPFETYQTPWTTYLIKLLYDLTESTFKRPATELAAMAGIAFVFISEGANLDEMVDMFFSSEDIPGLNNYWVPSGIQGCDIGGSDGVFASIPAYLIISILTETMRLYPESTKESCMDSCISLEQACLDHRSREEPRVFAKRKVQDMVGISMVCEAFVVCETTHEMQMQFGKTLIEVLRRQLSLKGTLSDCHIGPEVCSSPIHEMYHSILKDKSWVEVTHGEDAYWDWLEDRGLLKFVDESPGIDEWVKMRSQDFLQSGQVI